MVGVTPTDLIPPPCTGPSDRGTAADAVPPLRNGDHMDREEYHRRYEAMGEGTRAELIGGIVYLWSSPGMASPVSIDRHGTPHLYLSTAFGVYCSKTPGLLVGGDATVLLTADDEPQPDVLLGIPVHAGGQTRLVTRGDKRYVGSAPELVAEVSASTVSIDLHAKLRSYERAGVREYLVWRTEQEAIDAFTLGPEGTFVPMTPDHADGLTKSVAFPGLWLDRTALIRGDLPAVFAAIERGCATDAHAAFLDRLKQGLEQPVVDR